MRAVNGAVRRCLQCYPSERLVLAIDAMPRHQVGNVLFNSAALWSKVFHPTVPEAPMTNEAHIGLNTYLNDRESAEKHQTQNQRRYLALQQLSPK